MPKHHKAEHSRCPVCAGDAPLTRERFSEGTEAVASRGGGVVLQRWRWADYIFDVSAYPYAADLRTPNFYPTFGFFNVFHHGARDVRAECEVIISHRLLKKVTVRVHWWPSHGYKFSTQIVMPLGGEELEAVRRILFAFKARGIEGKRQRGRRAGVKYIDPQTSRASLERAIRKLWVRFQSTDAITYAAVAAIFQAAGEGIGADAVRKRFKDCDAGLKWRDFVTSVIVSQNGN